MKIYRTEISLIKLLCFLFIFVQMICPGQKTENENIDIKITAAENLYRDSKAQELFKISNDICESSDKYNYEKGLVYGHFYTACSYSLMKKNVESIQHIYKSQSYTDYLSTDQLQLSRNYSLLGNIYRSAGFYVQGSQNLKKAVEIVDQIKIKNPNVLYNESVYYGRLSILYEHIGKPDSMYYCLNKEKVIHKILKDKIYYAQKSSALIRLGNYFYFQKKSDSALYYYKEALTVLDDKNHRFKVDALIGLGNFYNEKKKYDDAKLYYLQAIDASRKNDNWELSYAYERIADLYYKTGENKKSKTFETLSKKINDSTGILNRIQRESIASEVLKLEKDLESNKSKQLFSKIVSVTGIIIILISSGVFFIVRRRRKKLTIEKDNLIQQKEAENQDLKQKVNESFEEVVQLAKENSPEFLTRFQEVYPEFSGKLKEIYPDISSDDLRFCALLKLNFSTKDIAEYTFVTIRTVQTRKSRLRKKFNIPSDQDIYLWINEL